jgi:hypothetical protein
MLDHLTMARGGRRGIQRQAGKRNLHAFVVPHILVPSGSSPLRKTSVDRVSSTGNVETDNQDCNNLHTSRALVKWRLQGNGEALGKIFPLVSCLNRTSLMLAQVYGTQIVHAI